jgi:hypothetical protein
MEDITEAGFWHTIAPADRRACLLASCLLRKTSNRRNVRFGTHFGKGRESWHIMSKDSRSSAGALVRSPHLLQVPFLLILSRAYMPCNEPLAHPRNNHGGPQDFRQSAIRPLSGTNIFSSTGSDQRARTRSTNTEKVQVESMAAEHEHGY